MSLKDNVLRCFFINRPDSPYFESDKFKHILGYLQTGTNKAKLKQTGRLFLLVVNDIKSMDEMLFFLKIWAKQWSVLFYQCNLAFFIRVSLFFIGPVDHPDEAA